MFKDKYIHMIGIGGVSMSGIAELLTSMGAIVTGSDVNTSKITKHLEEEGIKVAYGHHPELIDNSDIVIYTAAISEDDPERKRAKELNKVMYERSEALGIITTLYKNCLCISGTHGKSTTTGMVSLVFLEANLDPTIQIGAILPTIGGTSRIGSNDYLIMESCEYVDSFLQFHPTSEVITNIDNDHLDYFKNLDNIKKSFNKYTNLLNENGYIIKNNDDENSVGVEDNSKGKVITYGINNNAKYMARNINYDERGCYSFDLYIDNEYKIKIDLNINGKHNVYNALATIALSSIYIDDLNVIKSGIEKYHGVERRFQYIGKYKNVSIYDDYAHHPTEIMTTLESTKKVKHNESWAVFQAHTYSRTVEHLHEFAKVLSGFDHVVIAKIFAAREENIYGITEDMIIDEIKKYNKNAININEYEDIVTYLKDKVMDDDVVITIGAGPVNKVGYMLKELDK